MGFTRSKTKHKRKRMTKKRPFFYKGGTFRDLFEIMLDNEVSAKNKNGEIMSYNIQKFKEDNLNKLTEEETNILYSILDKLPIARKTSIKPNGPTSEEIKKTLVKYNDITPERLEETIEEELNRLLNGNGTIQTDNNVNEVCLLIYLYLSGNVSYFVLPFFPEQFITIAELRNQHETLQDIFKLIVKDNKNLKFLLLEVVLFLCTKDSINFEEDNQEFKGIPPFSPKLSSAISNGPRTRKLSNRFGDVKYPPNNLRLSRTQSEPRGNPIRSKTITKPSASKPSNLLFPRPPERYNQLPFPPPPPPLHRVHLHRVHLPKTEGTPNIHLLHALANL